MKRYFYILSLLVLVLMSSCVTSRKVNYMQKPNRDIPTYTDTLSYEDYVLRIGDRLYVYVYSLDESISKMYNSGSNSSMMRQMMSNSSQSGGSYDLYTYLVDEEGNIEFPTLGKVYVRGLTTREVKRVLEGQLATLLKDQDASSISVEARIVHRTFSIIGAQSGRYEITKEKMTIFEALAMAGDIREFNSRKEIKLVREINGVTTIKTFDVRSEDIVNSEYYYVEPNDIIYIRQIPGYSFGINSASATLGICASTISFGVFIYSIVQTGINHVNKYYPKNNGGSNAAQEGGNQ